MLYFRRTGEDPKRSSCPARGKTDLVPKRVANIIDVQRGGRCTRHVSVCVSGWISSKRGLSAEAASATLLILSPELTAKSPAQPGSCTGKAGATAAVTQSRTSSYFLPPPTHTHTVHVRVQCARMRCGETGQGGGRRRAQAEGRPRRARPSLPDDILAPGHGPRFSNPIHVCSLFGPSPRLRERERTACFARRPPRQAE